MGGIEMAYQIHYDETAVRRGINEKPATTRSIVRVVLVVAICLAAIFALGNKSVQQFLIPGNDALTIEAMNIFVDELRNGESFRDAATAFCREIIDIADVE